MTCGKFVEQFMITMLPGAAEVAGDVDGAGIGSQTAAASVVTLRGIIRLAGYLQCCL